ncbi:hypothetical protein GCM10022209_27010 [Chitinophaga oryziterrae]
MLLLFSSFTPKQAPKDAAIVNYAWYNPAGQFIAWSTLANAEIVSDATTDPTNGTLVAIGYSDGGPTVPPVGAPIYRLYTHP